MPQPRWGVRYSGLEWERRRACAMGTHTPKSSICPRGQGALPTVAGALVTAGRAAASALGARFSGEFRSASSGKRPSAKRQLPRTRSRGRFMGWLSWQNNAREALLYPRSVLAEGRRNLIPQAEVTAEPALPIGQADAEPSAPLIGENEAAVLDTFVVPAYLAHLWALGRRLLLVGSASRVVHLGSGSGYPDAELLGMMPQTTGIGVEQWAACNALARSKVPADAFAYIEASPQASGLPEQTFSHALSLHAPGDPTQRALLFREMMRLLYGGGQALVCLPLGQSFPELLDLLAEYALKVEDAAISDGLEAFAQRPLTVESIAGELESEGLHDVDFETADLSLVFDSGRSLIDDPTVRFFIAPTLAGWLGTPNLDEGLAYVARAVDKYWSDESLELKLKIAAFSARR